MATKVQFLPELGSDRSNHRSGIKLRVQRIVIHKSQSQSARGLEASAGTGLPARRAGINGRSVEGWNCRYPIPAMKLALVLTSLLLAVAAKPTHQNVAARKQPGGGDGDWGVQLPDGTWVHR